MSGSFRIIYHRRKGMSQEIEMCACIISSLDNVKVVPIESLSEAGDVKAWTVKFICDFITAHMRLGERLEVYCAGIDWPPEAGV